MPYLYHMLYNNTISISELTIKSTQRVINKFETMWFVVLILSSLTTAAISHPQQSFSNRGEYLHRTDLIDLPPIDKTSQPHHDETPYPWKDIFHYPYFQYQTGILSHQWQPMTYEEAHKYYNAFETCVVMANNPEHCTPQKYKHNDIGACGIYDRGMIWPQDAPCPHMKGNFIRHVSTKPWPESKHIVDIMAKMKERGSNLIYFIGDSVTGQHFAETYCSLARAGVTFLRAERNLMIARNPNYNNSAPINGPYKDNEDVSKRFFSFRFTKYDRGGGEKWSKILSEIETVRLQHETPIVFVVNMGLHFNYLNQEEEMKEMYRNLKEFLSFFIELSQKYGHIIIFRETSAQHFQTINGLFQAEHTYGHDYEFILNEDKLVDNQVYFSPLMDASNRKQYNGSSGVSSPKVQRADVHFCKPIRTKQELHENNWRNREVFKILDELDLNHEHVHIAKFHEITAGRHDMHAIGTDCTHYCPSPILWYPLWQNIYDIVEHVYNRRNVHEHKHHPHQIDIYKQTESKQAKPA